MREIREGTKMYFGAPAKPMPEASSRAITQAVSQIPEILQAHLPQCFIEGDQEARQILVITVNQESLIPEVMQKLIPLLLASLPKDQFVDVLPFPDRQLMPAITEAGCKIFSRDKKAWWRLW